MVNLLASSISTAARTNRSAIPLLRRLAIAALAHYCYPATSSLRTQMTSTVRATTFLTALLGILVVQPLCAQNQPKPDESQQRETTGTKKDVEKRLKAEEKPK